MKFSAQRNNGKQCKTGYESNRTIEERGKRKNKITTKCNFYDQEVTPKRN